jgi:hypothetical protein
MGNKIYYRSVKRIQLHSTKLNGSFIFTKYISLYNTLHHLLFWYHVKRKFISLDLAVNVVSVFIPWFPPHENMQKLNYFTLNI